MPVLPHSAFAGLDVKFEDMGGRNLEDAREQGIGTRNVEVRKVIGKSLPVQFSRVSSGSEDRLDFRSKAKSLPRVMIVERFNAEVVARKYELPAWPIINC